MSVNRVLIVDDEENNLYLLRIMLQGNGYDVVSATNGLEALEKARQYPPDLIIADVLMPVMDGFALCRAWKMDPLLKQIPFVFYTATYTDERDREFALNLGAERFVVKPEEPDTFMALVRDVIRHVEVSPQAAAKPKGDTPAQSKAEAPDKEEPEFLRQYNEALIRKLEAKMRQLVEANRELELDISARRVAEKEREELQVQLLQARKMESVGRLAGGVAHDFNNMLSVIIGNSEVAMMSLSSTHPLYHNLQEILSAAHRSADLTRQLLAFARKQTVTPKVLELNETVSGMLKMLQRLIGEDIHLAWAPGRNLWPLRIDPSQVDQILANLCVNARDAISGVGTVSIRTEVVTFEENFCKTHSGYTLGEYVLLAVSDDGCGMDPVTLESIFEPFFTTKEEGKGTGLGLATVYGIVKQNNGFIVVVSEPGKGTTFSIYLPRYRGKVGLPRPAGAAEETGGHETVLLVEDEPAILRIGKDMLEQLGYKVLLAGTPGEAIEMAVGFPGEIHLLMTDVVMPEMNGRELAGKLLSYYPNLKRLFMSGYTADVIAHRGILEDGLSFLHKPFSVKELASKVREVLDKE